MNSTFILRKTQVYLTGNNKQGTQLQFEARWFHLEGFPCKITSLRTESEQCRFINSESLRTILMCHDYASYCKNDRELVTSALVTWRRFGLVSTYYDVHPWILGLSFHLLARRRTQELHLLTSTLPKISGVSSVAVIKIIYEGEKGDKSWLWCWYPQLSSIDSLLQRSRLLHFLRPQLCGTPPKVALIINKIQLMLENLQSAIAA